MVIAFLLYAILEVFHRNTVLWISGTPEQGSGGNRLLNACYKPGIIHMHYLT